MNNSELSSGTIQIKYNFRETSIMYADHEFYWSNKFVRL